MGVVWVSRGTAVAACPSIATGGKPMSLLSSWLGRSRFRKQGPARRSQRRGRAAARHAAFVSGMESLEGRKLLAVTAVSDTVVVCRQDVEVTIDVLANDSNVPVGAMINSTTQGGHGSVQVLHVAGQQDRVRYRPTTGFSGSDSFTYSLADGAGGMATGVVSITIAPSGVVAGISGAGYERAYSLADGFVVDPNAPFRPHARGNYTFTAVRSISTQKTDATKDGTQITDIDTSEGLVVTSTESPTGAWTYGETLSISRYAMSYSTGAIGIYADLGENYSHTFNSSGSATASTYTFNCSANAVGSGSQYDTWSRTDGSSGDVWQFFISADSHSMNVTSSANLTAGTATGTLAGSGEGGTLVFGSGTSSYPITGGQMTGGFDTEERRIYGYERTPTTFTLTQSTFVDTSHSASGSQQSTFTGGSIGDTRHESGSTSRRILATTVSSRDGLGHWTTAGSAAIHASGTSSQSYEGTGSYTQQTVTQSAGESTSGSLSRDGGFTSSYGYDWTELLDASGASHVVSGTGQSSLRGGDRWSQIGGGDFWLAEGGFSGGLSHSSSEAVAFHYDTNSSIANGAWVTSGTGGGTSSSRDEILTDGLGTYASTTVGPDATWSVSGDVMRLALDVRTSTSTWNETLDATGHWALDTASSHTVASSASQAWHGGLGSYSYGPAANPVSGTFAESGEEANGSVITLDSSFTNGTWTSSGNGVSRVSSSGYRDSSGRGTYAGAGAAPMSGTILESAHDGWEDDTSSTVQLIGGQWQLTDGYSTRVGDGTNTSSYGINGNYADAASGITGNKLDTNTENTAYHYLVSSQYVNGDWATTGSASTFVTGNGTNLYQGQGTYGSAGNSNGLAWTSGGAVGEAGVTTTIYSRSWNEQLGPNGDWRLTTGTGMTLQTGHDGASIQGTGTYASQLASANPSISGTTTDSIRQGSDWRFTTTSAVSNGAWVDTGSGSGTSFDSNDTGYRGTVDYTTAGLGWSETWNGRHSGGEGSRTDDTWSQILQANGVLQTTAASSTTRNYTNNSTLYDSTGTYSVQDNSMAIVGTSSESGSSGDSSSYTTTSTLIGGQWVTTGQGGAATWDGGEGSSTGNGNYAYGVGYDNASVAVAGTIDEDGSWDWWSRYDTFSSLMDGRWLSDGFGGQMSSTTTDYTAEGSGFFHTSLPGSTIAPGGTGLAFDAIDIDGDVHESAAESFSRNDISVFMLGAPDANGAQAWWQFAGLTGVQGESTVTWEAWNGPSTGISTPGSSSGTGSAGSGATVHNKQSSGLTYDLWSTFDGDAWTNGGTSTITNENTSSTDYRRQGVYVIAGLRIGAISAAVTETGSSDREYSYEVVRSLSSDGIWTVTSGTGSSHEKDEITAAYADKTVTFESTNPGTLWDHATQSLTNGTPLKIASWFDTNSSIDASSGLWKTTGSGGSTAAGKVEMTFAADRAYSRAIDVDSAMNLITIDGQYNQFGKATLEYDFTTDSTLSASGTITTTGEGTASLTTSNHTWWNAGDANAPLLWDSNHVVVHEEHGDVSEWTKAATTWVYAGVGWREQQTVEESDNTSSGAFTSVFYSSWYAEGIPESDGAGTYGEGSYYATARGSHDYASSSELTRLAAVGGCTVTGWRTGSGESHGTSSVRGSWYDTREYLRERQIVSDDSYDYTGDSWRIEFDTSGMPTITYAGSNKTTEAVYETSTEWWYTNSLTIPEHTETRERTSAADNISGFIRTGGRSGDTFWSGYGNSFNVPSVGYGYSPSNGMVAAFGGALTPAAATLSLVPTGASTQPAGSTSAVNAYELRLAGLTSPRLITFGVRLTGELSAGAVAIAKPAFTMPTPASLGFSTSDSAPETPATRAFANVVTSGMAGPVTSPGTGFGTGLLDWFIGDARKVYENTQGMSPVWRAYTVGGFWLADFVGIRGLSDAFSTHDAADGHVQSWQERMSDGVFGGLSLAGTISGVGKGVIAATNKVDDVGRCMNALTRINLGACFTGDTLVQVTALAGEPSREPADDGSVATATLQTVSIATLPLGARVLAGNPRPEEMDHAFAEPEQATWVSVSVRMTKRDGTVVQAEFLRPREWVARHKILAGAALPIAITELEVEGNAIVTAISPCPQIATGEGRVVTGRFVTREAGNLVRLALENGTEIRATDVHPVWSVDREEWVPAGELEPGEPVDTIAGPVAVLSVERLESALDVYNIEVHGEHVFRVTADGVLVHNAGPSCKLGTDLAGGSAAHAAGARQAGWQAGHIVPWGSFSNRVKPVRDAIVDAKTAMEKAGIGLNDSWNGFWTQSSNHLGTHRDSFFVELGDLLRGQSDRQQILGILGTLRDRILAGEFAK